MNGQILRKGIVITVLPLLLVGLLACRLGKVQATPGRGPTVPPPAVTMLAPVPEGPVQPASTTSAPVSETIVQQTSTSGIVVDNADPGFHIEAGEWGTCWDGDCGGTCYGEDFRYAEPTCVSCRARFDYTVTEAGEYDVWTWWPWGEDRATDTPFTLMYGEGPLTVNVDQRNSGDDWYWLATLPLAAGESGSVVIEGTPTGYANADAVALTAAGSGPPSVTMSEAELALSQPWDDQAIDGEPIIQYFYAEEITDRESCYYLHWDVSDATTVFLNDSLVDALGSTEICPEESEDYTLRAKNSVDGVEQSLTVTADAQDTPQIVRALPGEQDAPPEVLPAANGSPSVIFLHHSCGANLIEQGGVRQRLAALGYLFYDHGYNGDGLVLPDGTWTGRNFNVPDDNTNPDGFATIFSQPLPDPPDNTFGHLMQYDVIAFKSCFPVSHIESDAQLAEYKSYYLSIRNRIDQHPEKLFIVVTQPPEIPNDTDPQAAARARAFTDWLASDEYLGGRSNVFTFNFFDLLADHSTHMLRPEYRTDEYDAHPNESANRTVGPLFADFIDRAVNIHQSTF